MKYRFLIFLCFICLFNIVFSQTKEIDVHVKDQPAAFLFDQLTNKSGVRIFTERPDIDSIRLTMDMFNSTPLIILQKAFEKKSISVNQFQDIFYLSYKTPVNVDLPLFSKDDATTVVDEFENSNHYVVNAYSEYKLYDIGRFGSSSGVEKLKLKGKILQLKTGDPIPGATIYITPLLQGTTTDKNGVYQLELPPGKYELEVRGVGLENTKRQFRLNASGEMNVEVDEGQVVLNELTITSSAKSNLKDATMGVERLKIKDMKNIPMAFGEMDVLKAVMALPGVKSSGEISSGFNVRGGSTDQNLILFNDGTIFNPTHLFGLFSAFNPDVVKDMELYMSNIPAQYGGRISSVLDIQSREGANDKLHGSASIGLLTSRLSVEGPLGKKTTFIMGGRSTYSDWLLNLIPENSGFNNASAGFYDLNMSVAHHLDTKNKLTFNAYFSQDQYSFDSTENIRYQNRNLAIKWEHISNQRLSFSLSMGYDSYWNNIKNIENEVNAYNLASGINQVFLKNDYRYILSNKHVFNWGINSVFYNLNPGAYSPEGSNSVAQIKNLQHDKAIESALYISDKWDVNDRLSLNLGLRYSQYMLLGPRDYYTYDSEYLPSETTVTDTVHAKSGVVKTYGGPEFRFSMRYILGKDWSVKAGVNTMRQYIHKISNSTVMSPTDTWKLSDTNILPQTGAQLAVGLYKNFDSNKIETSIETYYKTMNNYLDYKSGAVLVMNEHLETDVVSTRGKAYGAEFIVKKPGGRLSGWISYAYARTFLRQDDKRNATPVNDGDWYPADFDKPHEFKLVGNYKFTQRYSISYNCFYSTGRPITLPVAKYRFMDGEYIYYSDRNKYRIPDFFRIDAAFNVEPSHHLTVLTHSSLSFGVYNLTGRNNVYSIYFKSVNGELKGYQLSIFGVPIPYISYNIKF